MPSSSARVIFGIGLAVLIAGAVTGVYVFLRPDQGKTAERVAVLVAAKPITAGTTASSAASQGLIQQKTVTRGAVPDRAVIAIDELAGTVAAMPVAAGDVITSDMFTQAQTRIGTVRIPPGRTALALEMENVAGIAGFAGAGDKVNIYGVDDADDAGNGPGVRLILPSIEVLSVNGVTLTADPGKPGAERLVFLLAVSPAEAERLIYLSKFEQLYFSLVPADQSGPVTTPGAGPGTALRGL